MQEQDLATKLSQATCKRCGIGTLLLHDEIDGPELRCLQCGATGAAANGSTMPEALAS